MNKEIFQKVKLLNSRRFFKEKQFYIIFFKNFFSSLKKKQINFFKVSCFDRYSKN